MKKILSELWATVADVIEHGDLAGHLRAWWNVARGRITGETSATWPTVRGILCLRNG